MGICMLFEQYYCIQQTEGVSRRDRIKRDMFRSARPWWSEITNFTRILGRVHRSVFKGYNTRHTSPYCHIIIIIIIIDIDICVPVDNQTRVLK